MLWKSIQILPTIKYKHKRVNTAALKIPSNSTDDTAALVLLQLECWVLPNDLSTCGMAKIRDRELRGTNSCPGTCSDSSEAKAELGLDACPAASGPQKTRCLLMQATCVYTSWLPEARMGMLLWLYSQD